MSQYLPMRLEETAAFGPFPREFILFAQIAGWASKNNITDIICRDISTGGAANRIGVLDMIDVFAIALLKLGMTARRIVALVALASQKLLNLYMSMVALDIAFVGTAFVLTYAMLCLCFCAAIVYFSIGSHVFLYLWAASIVFAIDTSSLLHIWTAFVGTYPLLLPWCALIDAYSPLYFRETSIMPSVRLCIFFYIRAKAIYLESVVFTILALLVKTVLFSLITMKKICICRKNSFAIGALFITTCNDFLLSYYFGAIYCASTVFAMRSQPVFSRLAGMKVLCGSRKELFTHTALLLRGILGYSVTHDKAYSLSSHPWSVSSTRKGKTLLPPHFTINPPFGQLEEVFV